MGRFFRRQRLQQRQQNKNNVVVDNDGEGADKFNAVKIVVTNSSSGEQEVQTSHLPPNAANVVVVSDDYNATEPLTTPKDAIIKNRVGEIGTGTSPTSSITKNVLSLSTETPRISNIVPVAPITHPPHPSNHQLSTPSFSSHTTCTTAPINGGKSRKLPGVFILIEQGNWAKAAERAKKYPHECRKWATIKRKQGSVLSHSITTSPRIANNVSLSSGSSIASGTSSYSNSTFKSGASSVSGATATIANHGPHTSVTCKALHHACLRLNNVHSQIRDLISMSRKEINQIQEMMNNNTFPPQNHVPSPAGNNRPNSPTSCSSPPSPAHLERKSTIDSLSSCASACNVTEGLSFDDSSDNDNSVEIAGRISPTFGRFVNYVKGSIPSSSSNSTHHNNYNHYIDEDEVWDDPWIEACKAILTILEICPEAAQQRESRHGCLPIHLAAFAMCPTPTASLPKDYDKYKCYLNSNIGQYPCAASSPQTPRRSQGGLMNHKEVIAASHSEHHAHNSSNDTATLPPRPLQLLRGKSGSSAVSCASANSSIGGFSASLIEGGGCSIGATSSASELSDVLVAMEEKLRIHQNSLKSESSDGSRLTKEEEEKLLEHCTRPRPISGFYDRGSSIESVNSCSNSVISGTSTAVIQTGSPPKVKHREFYLHKYIDNAERREEYSLKVITALLGAYKKGATKDSEGGRLPLHTALTGRATFKVLETLIAAYPPACRHRTKEGSLPLHLAARYGVSDERIAPMLLKTYPDSSVGKNKHERTPFEEGLLMGGENGREHQEKLMEALRKPAFYWTSEAISQIAQRSIFDYTDINDLLKGEGAGIQKRMASLDDDSEDDDDEDLISLIKRQEWTIITEKIDFFTPFIQAPFQAMVRAGYNAKVSALHLACEQNPTYDVLDALVSACPGAMTWRMFPYGELPLHIAATWKASPSVIGFLIAANPLATKQADRWGNLPLHCACFSGAPEEIIESLLCVHPKAVNVKNIQGSRPRDIVRRLSHQNKKTILDLIDRVSLELLKKKRQRPLPADISNVGNGHAGKDKYRLGRGHEKRNDKDQQELRVNPPESRKGAIERVASLDREDMLWV